MLTPVLADWESALRIYRYPETDWGSLVEEAQMLFFAVTEQVRPEKTEGPFEHPDLDEHLKENIESYSRTHRDFVEQWLTN